MLLQLERCISLQEAQNKLKAACSEPSNSPKGLQLLLPPKPDPESAESPFSPEADAPEAAAAGTAEQALSADGQNIENEEEAAESQITQPVEATVLGSEAVAEPPSNEIGATAIEAVETELLQQQQPSDEAATAGPLDGSPGAGSSEQQGAAAASPGGSGCNDAPDTAAFHSPAHLSAALLSTDAPTAETSASSGPEGPALSESTATDEPLPTATPSPSAVAAAGLSSASLSESPTQTGLSEQSAGSTPQPEEEAAVEERLAAAEEPGFARPTVSSMLRQRPAAGPAKSRLCTDLGSVSTLAGCLFKARHRLRLAVFLHNIQSCSVALPIGARFSSAAHT